MSRLVGFLGPEAAAQLDRMAAAIRPPPAWEKHAVAADGVAFAVWGRAADAVVRHDGVLVAVDGYVYNRDALGRYAGDAEAVADLYRQHGFTEALARLNGDFAIALYDEGEKHLWLGRDRFGVKPLYYVLKDGLFAFASRPRSLLALPNVSREVNRQFVAVFAASHYRYFDNDPGASPYAEIRQLPAAHALCVTDCRVTKQAYWSLTDREDFTEPEDELARRYRELLLNAVTIRLKRARRPGFTLSGGMDSSSVLASAVRTSGAKQHGFSSVYEDKTYDEADDIRSILDATVEQWHAVTVGNPDVFGLVRQMVAVHDEPVATATWLSHFLVCQEAAADGFGGLFGGLGGDELNAGEYEHFFYFFADLRKAGDEARLRREVEMWAHYHDHPIYRKNFAVAEEALGRLVDLSQPGRCRLDHRRFGRYAAALNRDYFDLGRFEPVMEHPFGSYLKNRTYQDMTRETIPCCLRAEDRQTAAFGLDNFVPFFDHGLVEFMFRVPGTIKYRAGVTKHLLREAMRGVLPEATRTRVKKTGWNAPAHVWFSGPRRQPLLDLLHSRAFRERGIWNVAEVLRLADEHEEIVTSGRAAEHHMMFFWQLVNLELWLQSLNDV